MNDSYTQQALASDPNFRKRVRSAMSTVAWQIVNEAESVANHDARIAYARQVVRGLDNEVTVMLPNFVFRPNVINFETTHEFDFPTQIGQTVTAAGDADLMSQIATDWDDLAAAAGFVEPPPAPDRPASRQRVGAVSPTHRRPVSAVPLTLSLWVKTGNPAQASWCGTLCHSTVNAWFLLGTVNTTGAIEATNTTARPRSTRRLRSDSLPTPGRMWPRCSRARASSVFNGAAKGTDTTTTIARTLDRLLVGALISGALSANYWDGDVAEFAIYNAALSDAEVAQLATGLAATSVRGGNLVAYYPLLGTSSPEPDVMGGTGLTLVNGPMAAAHPQSSAAAPAACSRCSKRRRHPATPRRQPL